MIKAKLNVLHSYYNETNLIYRTYKKEQDKIIYFAGTIFISIITLTGIFGALNSNNLVSNFKWFHLLLFHTIFFILYLFYSYKTLCAEVYLITGLEIENATKKLLQLPDSKGISLLQLKNMFLGDSVRIKPLKKGLNPGKVANILILALYFFTSLGPYVILELKRTKEDNFDFKIDSNLLTIFMTLFFVIVFGIVDRRLYKRRREVRLHVQAEVRRKLEDFTISNFTISSGPKTQREKNKKAEK